MELITALDLATFAQDVVDIAAIGVPIALSLTVLVMGTRWLLKLIKSRTI